MMGDNEALFNTANSSYQTAFKLSKYLNTAKVCTGSEDEDCTGVYYDVKYANAQKEGVWNIDRPAIILTDGSIIKITQDSNCYEVVTDELKDADGNIVYDETTGTAPEQHWLRDYCAIVYIDVNGQKKPNKFSEDVFKLNIYKDKILPETWVPYGTEKAINSILTNSK